MLERIKNTILKAPPFDGWRNFPFAEPGFLKLGLLPKISVIIPCFNHGRYLSEAIRTTRNAAKHFELEIILVDDGSTDDTIKVLQKTDFPGLKKFTREHAGLAVSLNFGFSQSTGQLVTWTSADNRYLPGVLDRMANFLIANPAVGMTYGNVQLIDDSGAIYYSSSYRRDNQRKSDSSVLDLPCEISALGVYSDNFINACFLLRREVWQSVGSYDPEKLGYEDYDFWLRVAARSLIAHVDTNEPLYQYRLHENSLTSQLRMDSVQSAQYEMLTGKTVTSLPDSSREEGPAALSLPAVLRRARDANFGAITLNGKEKFAALLVYKSWSPEEDLRLEAELPELMEAVPECRFVILNWGGNEIDSPLRSKLESMPNFTLLDFSSESDAIKVLSSGEPNRWGSLTCAVSSCAVLLETIIGGDERSESRALETLQLGALTRRNVFFFHTNSENFSQLYDVPHAILSDVRSDGRRKKLREILLAAANERPPIGSCEQYLRLSLR